MESERVIGLDSKVEITPFPTEKWKLHDGCGKNYFYPIFIAKYWKP